MASEPRYISVVAIADGERRAVAGGDQQLLLALEHEGQREGAAQLLERARDRHLGIEPAVDLARHPERDGLRVGLRLGQVAVLGEVGEQLAEILDDAVVDHRDLVGRVRMGIALGRRAVGGPARVADADHAVERLDAQLCREIAELALGAAARDLAALERRDAGAVIAAILEPLQRIDQARRDRFDPDDPDDAAHG